MKRSSCLLLRASDGSQLEQSLDPAAWAVALRLDLGQALLERALANSQVELVRDKVTDAQQVEGGWQLRTVGGQVHCADFLVGADGARSIVRRRMVGPIPRQHLSLTVGYRVQCAGRLR